MMAALIRYALVNPYWNVPPDLNETIVAPAVLRHGPGYLSERKYEVFSDDAADRRLDPATRRLAGSQGRKGYRCGSAAGPGPAIRWATSSS